MQSVKNVQNGSFTQEHLICISIGLIVGSTAKTTTNIIKPKKQRKRKRKMIRPQCKTCNKRFDLKRFDYSTIGCEHTDMDGFICMAFADENIAIWMVGINEDTEGCECYTKRRSE